MTASSSTPFDWLRATPPDLKQLDSIPLTGGVPAFPWEDFSARLAKAFDREGLTIHPGEIAWRSKENLYEGLGDAPVPLNFSIPPLRGQVSWVMPEQEMSILLALLLTHGTHPLPLHDQALNESFYHFLALEVLYNLTQVSFDKTLSPILTNQTNLPDQDSLCWDISISMQDQTIWGRLIISPEFRSSWVEHFAQQQESLSLSQQMKQLANVIVHLEAGKIDMTLAEWKSVQLGDFLLLDRCSLDAEKLDGRVMLTIQGKPTFRAKLKEGTLKILELPLLHEVETPMAKQSNDDDDLSDLDLPEENGETEEEEFFTEDDDLFTEEEEELTESEAETETTQQETTTLEENMGETQTMEAATVVAAPQETKRLINPEQIPVTLIVEVGQVQMTMEQLLQLEPGNLLEVNIHPKNGVDLTLNGKVVGKGELIRIGETIGVRVLELGR